MRQPEKQQPVQQLEVGNYQANLYRSFDLPVQRTWLWSVPTVLMFARLLHRVPTVKQHAHLPSLAFGAFYCVPVLISAG